MTTTNSMHKSRLAGLNRWTALICALFAAITCGATAENARPASLLSDMREVNGASVTPLPDGRQLVVGGLRAAGAAHVPIASNPLKIELVTPRVGHTATLLPDGRVLVLGGVGAGGHVVRAVELIDTATTKSTVVTGSTLLPRTEHTATVMTDGRVLIAGGVGEDGKVLADVEVFDTNSGLNERINPKLQTARFGHIAALLPSSPVLVWSGFDDKDQEVNSAELYDPATQRFLFVEPKDVSRYTQELTSDVEPAVRGGIPAADSVDFPVDGLISVRFSKRLQMQSLNADNVVLYGPLGMVKTKVVPVEAGALVFVTPEVDLQPGASYTLLLNGPIDPAGRRLPFSSVKFRTAPLGVGAGVAGSGSSTNGRANVRVDGSRTDVTQLDARASSSRTWDASEISDEPEEWIPGPQNFHGNWRTARASAAAAKASRPQGREGVTSLSGRILRLNAKPLSSVTLSIGDRSVKSDADGYFLLEGIAPGTQTLVIDGATANSRTASYGYFESVVRVEAGRLNELPYTVWMPKLDTDHVVKIPSPTTEEVVVTSPSIPGFEVRIPAGVVLRDRKGKIVTEVGITPVPLDRAPFPQPMDFPAYYTIQPGGAVIQSIEGQTSRPARLVYPNYTNAAPGAITNAWVYDPTEKGWYVYGHGTVSADGRKIDMDPDVGLYQFTGSAHSFSPVATPVGPPPDTCECQGQSAPDTRGKGKKFSGSGSVGSAASAEAGDPVSLATGIFVAAEEDLVVDDLNPLSVLRVYRHTNPNLGLFGYGWSSPLDWSLAKPGDGTILELVMPNGTQIEYVNTNGTGCCSGVYKNTSSPGIFYNSTLTVPRLPTGSIDWQLTLKDGRSYFFNAHPGVLTGFSDRYGNKTTITRFQDLAKIKSMTGPTGRTISFTLNADGTVAQMSDTLGRTYTYSYQNGYLMSVTDAAGRTRSYSYDANNRLRTITDPTGNVMMTNDYDANNRVSMQTYANAGTMQFVYTLDANGKVTQTDVTDQRGNIRRVTFNSMGYITTSTYPAGKPEAQTTSFSRDPSNGRILSTTDQMNRTTAYSYDAMGNTTSVTRLYGTPDAVTTTFTYEPVFNQLTSVTDPLNHTWTIGYDAAGHPTTTTDPLGHVTTRAFNSLGQVTSVTDANSHTTTFTYSGADLLQVTDALSRSTNYSSDAAGRPTYITDALGQITKLDYDGKDRLTKRTEPNGSSITFTYDNAGRLSGHRDQNNNLTQYGYGNLGLLTSRTDALIHVESRAYDIAGMLAQVTDRKGQVSGLTYDNRNRLTQIGYGATTAAPTTFASTVGYTYDAADRATQIADSVGGTITRTYDGLDRLTQEQTPEGTVSYTYDAAGRRSTMTVAGQPSVTYAWDNANRLTSITQGSDVVAFTYDNANRRTSTTLANGVVMSYAYDNADQLTSITYTKGATTIGDLQYTYDAAGRRVAVGGSLATVDLPAAMSSATVNANNQVTAWNGATLTYDLNGNLTGDGTSTYVWDARDQLASISGAATASFVYDGLGRRRSKTIGSAQTAFIYDGINFVQELNGATVAANLITGGIDELFSRKQGTTTSYPISDALGSVLALTDSAGATLNQYSFEPYGKLTVSGAASGNSQLYTGREDDGTGLMYYRTRYYSPTIARFVGEDPLGIDSDEPNFYAYVGGNPITWTDPLGLRREDEVGGRGGGFGVGGRPAPSFPGLADHAYRHGNGMSRGQYYQDAINHMQRAQHACTIKRDGQWKTYYYTRIGPDEFRLTVTTADGRNILTHWRGGINEDYLGRNGIQLPKGH